jgi:hypothetical protein
LAKTTFIIKCSADIWLSNPNQRVQKFIPKAFWVKVSSDDINAGLLCFIPKDGLQSMQRILTLYVAAQRANQSDSGTSTYLRSELCLSFSFSLLNFKNVNIWKFN